MLPLKGQKTLFWGRKVEGSLGRVNYELFEDIFIEPNGVTKWGNDVLCAIPKDIILMHIQEETETILNK